MKEEKQQYMAPEIQEQDFSVFCATPAEQGDNSTVGEIEEEE